MTTNFSTMFAYFTYLYMALSEPEYLHEFNKVLYFFAKKHRKLITRLLFSSNNWACHNEMLGIRPGIIQKGMSLKARFLLNQPSFVEPLIVTATGNYRAAGSLTNDSIGIGVDVTYVFIKKYELMPKYAFDSLDELVDTKADTSSLEKSFLQFSIIHIS